MATRQGAAGDEMFKIQKQGVGMLAEVLKNQEEIKSILSGIRSDLSALKKGGIA